MSVDPGRCANCGADVRAQLADGIERCIECATKLPLPLVNDEALRVRRHWRICFWLCFLLTPVAMLLFALQPNWFENIVPGPAGQFLRMMVPYGVVGTCALGTLTAGYCLARFHANPQTKAALIATTILFALGLAAAYAGILFVGILFVGWFVMLVEHSQ